LDLQNLIQFWVNTSANATQLEIIDLSGKTLYRNALKNIGNTQRISIDNLSLASGLYFATISTPESKKCIKFLLH
jgi:hypothetical protein